MEALWEHALDVLDDREIDDLYQFQDGSGILQKHRERFHSSGQSAKTKDKYFELIKMVLEKEISEKSNLPNYRERKEVITIQGYQDLTNKLLRKLTKQLANNYNELKIRVEKVEALLGGGGDGSVITDKLNDLNLHYNDVMEKVEELKDENLNHNTRLGHVESELAKREAIDVIEDQKAKENQKLLEVLGERIDKNEEHIDLLQKNDERQDSILEELEKSLPNLDNKLKQLEQADEYFHETHKELAKKSEVIEDEGKKLGSGLSDLIGNFNRYKEDKDMDDEKTKGKIVLILNDGEDMKKRMEEFFEKQNEIDSKQDKDIEALENDLNIMKDQLAGLQTDVVDGKTTESHDIENLKKNIDEVTEKIRQLEGISNQNADVINNFTVKQITYDEKFVKLEIENDDLDKNLSEALQKTENDLKQTKDELNELAERVKYNYQRLDPLSEVPLKIQNLERQSDETAVNVKFIRDKVDNLQNDVNNNSEKIAIETEWREKGDAELNNRIEKFNEQTSVLLEHIDDTDDKVRNNLERIVGLEEAHSNQQEKAVYVETLASRVHAMDEQKQQSEAKIKEEVEDTVKQNKEAIQKMWEIFEDRLNELKNENNSQNNQLGDLKEKTKDLADEIDEMKKNSKDLVDDELEKLSNKLQAKLSEIDELSTKNEKHVDNLRELNAKLVADIDKNKVDNLNKMEEKLEAIRREIPAIDKEDFDHLVDAKFKTEGQLNDLVKQAEDLKNALEKTKEDVDKNIETTHILIRESTERNDSRLHQITERLVIVEKSSEDSEDFKKAFDNLKEETKKKDEDLEEQIRTLDNQSKKDIEVVEKQVDEKTKVVTTQIRSLGTELDNNRRDLWTIFLEMYGTLRCYTIVMKSEGGAAQHQSACLGVYRSTDWFNNRPVYKQENGENYLYFNADNKSWIVASNVGNDYAWMRYQTSDGEEESHSSSSSSSSSSDEEGSGDERRIKKKGKKSLASAPWKDIRTPDLFNQGWQYKLSPMRMSEETLDMWMTDDVSLRVEPLGDVEKIMKKIGDIHHSKEID